MDTDNTQEPAEPSLASAGSQPVAYEIHWKGQDGQYLANPYIVFANEQPSEHWKPSPSCVPLYRQPQPTLTDEEREVLVRVADDAAYRAMGFTERVVRGLLERTK
jgi:hypothetical protein